MTVLQGLDSATFPVRDLELASYLSRLHGRTTHHLSASECETLALPDLLAMADADDAARWATLKLGYTDPVGASWLRDAIAAGYDTIGPCDLVCFAGAQEGLYAAMHALLSPGDHAITVVPSYQSMETIPIGICAVSGVALDRTQGWTLDIDAVAAAIRPTTRLVTISFPNNPTGQLLDRGRFDALVALCRHHGLWLLSDEVYRLTEYDPADRLPAAADAYERGVSLGVTSKAYGLPGLRIGWVACADPWLTDRLTRIRQYLSTCNAGPSEVLATIALKAGAAITGRNRRIAAGNLALLRGFFARHPALFDVCLPRGGVVCYPRYCGTDGVEAFVARMANDAGVVVLPAGVFASALVGLPEGHFRIGFGRVSFAEGLRALEGAL
ncbi:MAG: pyridoxal phosphate-dependent aminotransferase [Gemmatimonadaceae bacterium]|nr:pyridoxal phosphate-dependent aminotransferase [Acetobacteraceae bacterium]